MGEKRKKSIRDLIYESGNTWISGSEVPADEDVTYLVRYQGKVTTKWFASVEDRVAIKSLSMVVNSEDWCADDKRISAYVDE